MAGSQISKRESGKTVVGYAERKKFAEAFGITFDEFESKWRASKVHDRPAPALIPVINRGPAGAVQPYDHSQYSGGEYHSAMEYIDRGDINDDLAFALIIIGDSMEPALFEGDYAVFSPMTVPKPKGKLENGNVVFVRFTEESQRDGCTVARWFQNSDGSILLTKDNNRKYQPINAKPEDIAQLAVCIERRTRRL